MFYALRMFTSVLRHVDGLQWREPLTMVSTENKYKRLLPAHHSPKKVCEYYNYE